MSQTESVLAHGIGDSQDLPLPFDLVLQAGAVAVVLSFLAVSTLWRVPREPAVRRLPERWDRLLRARWWRNPLRVIVLALASYFVGDALFGSVDFNPAAHALFVWLWVGLVPVSIVFGPVWRALNPLRTLHAIACRVFRLPPTGIRPGDEGGGRWPAAIALLAFVWFELIAPDRTEPRVVGAWLSAYAAVQLGFAVVRGEAWFARGDGFEVYSELAGRLSILGTDGDGRFVLRSPLAGLTDVTPERGTMAFVAVWWGSTIFDSASGSPWWVGTVQSTGMPVLVATAGLLVVCPLVLASLSWTARSVDIALALVPIAVGYTLAHYASLLIVAGPRGLVLLVRQWGSVDSIDLNVTPNPTAVAVFQIACILVGHLLAVLVAHDRALRANPGKPLAVVVADELPSVLLMVAYTWAGLFLLFAA